ncbi:MAG: hypothetical protein ACR2QK_14310, partial [Acidimicrobiales bacterium]
QAEAAPAEAGRATDPANSTNSTDSTNTTDNAAAVTATPAEAPAEVAAEAPSAQGPAAATAAEASPGAGPPTGGEPSTKPNLSAALTLASVTDAFADQLDDVRQKVRVRFKGGRVLGVEGSNVVFGVPTAIHRDRCAEVKEEIEQAFSNHFGQPVTLEVTVDEAAPAPTMDPAKIESKPAREITADEDVGPVEELIDAEDQSANGLERLTKAFPGSTVVDPQPEQ